MKIIKKAKNLFKQDHLYKSMFLSVFYKPINMLLTFIYTPLLLAWLGDAKYGIWVTILSIINWINFFDVGIGNGLRNCISQEIAQKDYEKVKRSVSTAYRIMFYITGAVTVVVIILSLALNWKAIFNTEIESRGAVLISMAFVCINLFLSLQKSEYFAAQRAEIVSLQSVLVQLLNLICIVVAGLVSSGELIVVAIIFSLSTLVVNVFYSLKLWKEKEYLKPSRGLFDKTQINVICGLGIKFFVLQMAALVLFTTDNMIITYLYGPELVTPYSTVNKVFLAFSSVFSAMISPLWSRFTVAKEMKDYGWMRKIMLRMQLILIPVFIVMTITVIFFQQLSDIWLGTHLYYEPGLIITMGIYIFSHIYSTIYASAMNGMGNVNLQIAVAVVSAIINIPLSIFLAKPCGFGTTGVCMATGITSIIGNIIFTVHVRKIIKRGEQIA